MARPLAGWIAVLVLFGAALALARIPGAHARPVDPVPARLLATPTPTAGCVVAHTKQAAPLTVTLGSTVDVTLTARATCTGAPLWLHVVLVLEGSDALSMGSPGARAMQQSALAVVGQLDLPNHPDRFVGVVAFADRANRLLPLSRDERRARSVVALSFLGGGSEIDRGLAEAERVMQLGRRQRAPDDVTEVVVLYARGRDEDGCDDAVAAAWSLRSKGILVVTVCVGDDCDDRCMREIASSPRYQFPVGDLAGLLGLFRQITDRLRNLNVRSIVVTDTLGADVEYVPGSANPAPTLSAPDGRSHVWRDVYVPREGVTYTLKVRPLRAGRVATNERADGSLLDYKGRPLAWTFDVPFVTVLEPTPAPSPSATRVASATPTATTEATDVPPTATRTPTASATAPPAHQTVHLPHVAR